VAEATARLRDSGQETLVDAHEEPWGRRRRGLQSREGLLVGISYLPAFHEADDSAIPTSAVD
jgi:hypothetical protein